MTENIFSQLEAENRHLRDLVISFSAALLRDVALKSIATGTGTDRTDAERLFREAEECFRCARLPGLNEEIAHGLAAAGNELMAKAVSIETEMQLADRKK